MCRDCSSSLLETEAQGLSSCILDHRVPPGLYYLMNTVAWCKEHQMMVLGGCCIPWGRLSSKSPAAHGPGSTDQVNWEIWLHTATFQKQTKLISPTRVVLLKLTQALQSRPIQQTFGCVIKIWPHTTNRRVCCRILPTNGKPKFTEN